jgi:hypothetical protein
MFGGIAANNQSTVRVFNINPVIGHRAASERLSQSRNSCAVSDTGLMIHVDDAHASQCLMNDGAFLVAHLGGAQVENLLYPVDDLSAFIGGFKILVAGFLDPSRQSFQHPLPALFFPLVAVWSAVLGLQDSVVAVDHGIHGRAFCAQSPFADRVTRIAFGAHNLAVPHMRNVMAGY